MEEAIDKKSLFIMNPKEALSNSRISLIINDYNDIFSDFDPRPLNIRALSDDFIVELRKAIISRSSESLELLIMVPSKLRNEQDEVVIKRRIHEYFKRHSEQLIRELRKEKRKGVYMAFLGAGLGVVATAVSLLAENEVLRSSFLIILEPASWFTIWTGFDKIFLTSDSRKGEIDFHEKMSKIEINFQSY